MEGMEAEVIPSSDGGFITVLSGWLPDQAALAGVLQTVYDLGIPLLAVERREQAQQSNRKSLPTG